jgi:hypothetical protein
MHRVTYRLRGREPSAMVDSGEQGSPSPDCALICIYNAETGLCISQLARALRFSHFINLFNEHLSRDS